MPAAFLLAAEAAETSLAPFYIAAGVLTVFAVLLALVGTLRHATFPPSRGVSTALMVVCAVLVAGVMITSVVTA